MIGSVQPQSSQTGASSRQAHSPPALAGSFNTHIIAANQPFGEWGKIFPDQAMMVAVVDRLVHHATIFEMNVESYPRRAALERKRSRGRPPTHATIPANA